jgi:hypothetical protein
MKRILLTLIASAALVAPIASAQVLPFPIGGLLPAPMAAAAGPTSNTQQVGAQANLQFGEFNSAGNRVSASQRAASSTVSYPYIPYHGGMVAPVEESPIYPIAPIGPSLGMAQNATTVGAQLNFQSGYDNRAYNVVQTEQHAQSAVFPFGAAAATNSTVVGAQLNLQSGGNNTAENVVSTGQSATSMSGLPVLPLFSE